MLYFVRTSQKRAGWGGNPDKLVGPLTKAECDHPRESLELPAGDIWPCAAGK
jgi:hypothetical protein